MSEPTEHTLATEIHEPPTTRSGVDGAADRTRGGLMAIAPALTTIRSSAMSYIKLEAHYTEHTAGGVSVGGVGLTTTLNNGTQVEFPVPFLSIGNGLAIAPAVTPDGDAGLRMDFTRWTPLRYGTNRTAGFPVNFDSQDLAVRVARAFDADPNTRWGCTADETMAWLNTWAASHPALFPVPDGGGGR